MRVHFFQDDSKTTDCSFSFNAAGGRESSPHTSPLSFCCECVESVSQDSNTNFTLQSLFIQILGGKAEIFQRFHMRGNIFHQDILYVAVAFWRATFGMGTKSVSVPIFCVTA